MNSLRFYWAVTGSGLLLLSLGAHGQTSQPDSSLLGAATANMRRQAPPTPELDAYLYNGTEYQGIDKKYRHLKGHQYFQAGDPQLGNLSYDGALYENVALAYDIRLDQVVLNYPNTLFKLKLVDEKVAFFTVGKHTFVRLPANNGPQEDAPTGYYDLLSDGPVKLLAKRIKKPIERMTVNTLELHFEEVNKFYVARAGKLYPVSSKGGILKLFPDKKRELRKYVSTQKLGFQKAVQEQSFLQIIQYYNTLN